MGGPRGGQGEAACGSRVRVRPSPCVPLFKGLEPALAAREPLPRFRQLLPEVCGFEYKQAPTLDVEDPGSDRRAVSRGRCVEGLLFGLV